MSESKLMQSVEVNLISGILFSYNQYLDYRGLSGVLSFINAASYVAIIEI